jgi:hypothetical protein
MLVLDGIKFKSLGYKLLSEKFSAEIEINEIDSRRFWFFQLIMSGATDWVKLMLQPLEYIWISDAAKGLRTDGTKLANENLA